MINGTMNRRALGSEAPTPPNTVATYRAVTNAPRPIAGRNAAGNASGSRLVRTSNRHALAAKTTVVCGIHFAAYGSTTTIAATQTRGGAATSAIAAPIATTGRT